MVIIYLLFMIFSGGILSNIWQILFDLIIAFFAIHIWLAFFSQFMLPLTTIEQRLQVFLRLLAYIIGVAGPVIRIENGVIKERKGEREKTGPGVVILDTASAAMVRTPGSFQQPIGPGIYFTTLFESVGDTVDLHLQKGQIGPQENEDPFAPKGDEESDAAFLERNGRRYETQGVTRDGIEVIPRITVAVRLDVPENEAATRFGYYAESVRRVITSIPVNSEEKVTENKKVEITKFPLHLAADIWKECINRYTLDELFSSPPNEPTALQIIAQEIRDRLVNPSYVERDSFGRLTGLRRPSREYKLLRSRGLRLEGTNILFLKFSPAVEEQILNNWFSSWLMRAQREREYINQQRAYEREQGQHSAAKVYANRVTRYLGANGMSTRLNGEQILNQLIRGSIYLAERESFLHRQAGSEIQQLKEILEWCERENGV